MKKTRIQLEPMSYAMTEEFKTLRTNVLFCGDDKKVIMVTSAVMGEGKSQTSIRLAASLAEIKKKVLVIDADIRKSVLASRLQATNIEKGMTHFLSGQSNLSEVVYSTNIPGLHIIFSGPYAPNPTELLSGERFKQTLEYLRSMYDYIIIDSAPLGMVVDGAIVAEHSDGAIMVLESGAIKYRLAQNVKTSLENAGCPVLGVVLNKVDRKANGHYYSRYYGKYYGKNYGKYYGEMTGNKGVSDENFTRQIKENLK